MKLYISVEREARPTQAGNRPPKQRIRPAIHASPSGPALFLGRPCGSVAQARADVEALFGPIAWTEANKAAVELERASRIHPESVRPIGTPSSEQLTDYFTAARVRADELLDADEQSPLGHRMSGAADTMAWVIGIITSPPRLDELP